MQESPNFAEKPAMRLAKLFTLTALSSILSMGLMEQAHSGLYSLHEDPVYNVTQFSNLGWRATAQLYVPTNCESAVGTQTLGNQGLDAPVAPLFSSVVGCSGIQLLGTTLYLYDTAAPLVTLDTLVFGTYGVAPSNTSYSDLEDQTITSVSFTAGLVTGFTTSYGLRQAPADTLDGHNNFDFLFRPSLDPLQVQVLHVADSGIQTLNAAFAAGQHNDPLATGGAPTISFNRVPEPGSLALVMAALAGTTLARRWRRPARHQA
jgi:hypothetical protein